MLKHNLPRCVNPAGHHFLCIHCGSDMPAVARARRWTWPAAAAAMTSVAAVLLVMLTLRPEVQVPLRANHEHAAPAPAGANRVQARAEPVPFDTDRDSQGRPAEKKVARIPLVDTEHMPYVVLRDQLLAYGLQSWQPAVAAGGAAPATETLLPYREQLNRLLEQQGLSGS